jgi:hypothetical protein
VCRADGFSGACGQMNGDTMMMIDGNPSLDTDGDGKNDSVDNCRTTANPDQANEDADAFGDVCDPCPPLATFIMNGQMVDANADGDGDGVGNGCDPNPTSNRERIKLFEGFAAATPPAGTSTAGTWTFSNGQAHVNASSGGIATLYWISPVLKVDVSRADTIVTRMTVTQFSTGTTSIGAGILDPMDSNLHGVGCFNGSTGNMRQLLLLDSFPTGSATALQAITSANLPMAGALQLTRDATAARTRCELAGVMTPYGSGNVPPNGNQVGLRAISTSSDFDWFMWVETLP